MQFFQLHPAAEGSDRWRLELQGKRNGNERMWIVISTRDGTRIEIPINELAGDIECCNGRDSDGIAVVLRNDEQLAADRAESAAFHQRGEHGRALPRVDDWSPR